VSVQKTADNPWNVHGFVVDGDPIRSFLYTLCTPARKSRAIPNPALLFTSYPV